MQPDFIITDDPAEINYKEITTLFEAVGWGDRGGPEFLRRAFCSGGVVLFLRLRQGGDVLAIARALTDGVYYATIQDFIVLPAWQRQGLGKLLLAEMLQRLAHIPTVLVPALPGAADFYRRNGFVDRGQTLARFLNPGKELLFRVSEIKTAPPPSGLS